MKSIPVIDLHADTYMKRLLYKYSSTYEKAYGLSYMIDAELLKKGNVRITTQSLFISSMFEKQPLHTAMAMYSLMLRDSLDYRLIKTKSDIEAVFACDQTGMMVSIEGLEVIEGNLELLAVFHELGVRIVAPTWNRVLPYFAPVGEKAGIFQKGYELLKELERLDMILDVSHMSDQAFFDAAEYTSIPIIATHSNVRALNGSTRNLSDDQLHVLKERNGILGLNFYYDFLSIEGNKENSVSGYEWVFRTIEYIASKYSIDMVAIGSDFDGIEKAAPGLENASCYPSLVEYLLKRGLSQDDLEKIFYKNAYTLITSVYE